MNTEIKNRVDRIKKGETPPGYYQTEIGILPERWGTERLSENFDFKNGLNKEKEAFGTGTPIVNYVDVYKKRGISAKDIKGLVNLSQREIDNFKVQKGDVFFTRTSETIEEIGMTAVILDDLVNTVFSGFILRARPKTEHFVNEYLQYCFSAKSARDEIIKKSTYTTRALTNGKLMGEVIIARPPKEEQQKIASTLSSWDKTIELKEKLIEQKKKQKSGLMQRLLTGKVRLPGFGGRWKELRLGELLKERNETNYNHLELLSITSSNGVVKRSEIDIKDNSSEDKSKYKRICPLDIGYNTMRMWQGVSGVSEYEGIVSPAYTILKPTDRVDSYFMGYLFKLPKMINLFWRSSQGLVNDTLNLKYNNFKKIKVLIPTNVDEQKAIGKILVISDKQIQLLEQELDLLKLQKKGLMQLLLTGIVKVGS